MNIKQLKLDVADEVASIFATEFQIDVIETQVVPHSGDAAITFPNFDTKRQGAKLIDTCVLYIDIRRSTELNLTHRPTTVAKLYSAFVRAMARCARHHKGHVRGIIGDRVMVIFDRRDAFVNAVECAISMNSVAQFIINKHFRKDEVECGIGIDSGKMLATKTGVRRRNVEQSSYRNLVWLGRPANIASKLTDLAKKPAVSFPYPMIVAAFTATPPFLGNAPGFGFGLLPSWNWRDIYPSDFVRQLSMEASSRKLVHSDPNFVHMYIRDETYVQRPATKAILMTERVWNGYIAAQPQSKVVREKMFEPITLAVPGYAGRVFAGDVHYPELKA